MNHPSTNSASTGEKGGASLQFSPFGLPTTSNPPVPPQAVALMADPVPLEVRRLRVQNGSKRKRDLAAVQMAEELTVLAHSGAVTQSATEHWARAKDRLRADVPASTFGLWIEPLSLFGVDGTTLILLAPEGIRTWTERRYSELILEALAGSGFTSVRFVSGGEG